MIAPVTIVITPGQRFGSLTVERVMPGRWVECRCDCGNPSVVRAWNLARTNRCRKCKNAMAGDRTRTHGMSRHPLYEIWQGMKARCGRPNDKDYIHYGGRGIRVCDRWLKSFENFYADMAPTYQPGLEIDRYPDNDGHYEPGNCRWATHAENVKNRRVKTHCPRGHPLSESNLQYDSRGHRRCRECYNAAQRACYHRNKET